MYDKLQLNNYSAKELLIGFNKKDTKDLLNHMIDNYKKVDKKVTYLVTINHCLLPPLSPPIRWKLSLLFYIISG